MDEQKERMSQALKALWETEVFGDIFGGYTTRFVKDNPDEVEKLMQKHKEDWCKEWGILPEDLDLPT